MDVDLTSVKDGERALRWFREQWQGHSVMLMNMQMSVVMDDFIIKHLDPG